MQKSSDKGSQICLHFSRRCLSALPQCQLLQNNTSVFTTGRPLQQAGCQALGLSSMSCCPAHPPAFRRVRSPHSSLALSPRSLGRARKCEKCLSRYTLKSTASSRHRYPRHSLPGEHSKGTEGTVGDARLTALWSPHEVLSLHLYPHSKVRRLQIMAALSAQPGSFSRKVEMPPLNINS